MGFFEKQEDYLNKRRKMSLQRTLALVKPDAVRKADEIVEAAMQAGFTVLEVRVKSNISHPLL